MGSRTPRPPADSAPRARRGPARRWIRYVLTGQLVVSAGCAAAFGYYYVTLSRLIDARLQADRAGVAPRVFARPLTLRAGQALTMAELVDRLNDLGYAERALAQREGEFAVEDGAVLIVPRAGDARGRRVRVTPARATEARGASTGGRFLTIEIAGAGTRERLSLDPPLLTTLVKGGREKRRHVPLGHIPQKLIEAVLAVEDRRFYDHPGIDPIRIMGALITNLRADRPYLVGASTLTQQLVKNLFLTPEKTLKRKLLEQLMAVVLELRLSKDEILELYLNEVYLGQRGSFAVHGVSEGARLFFGKDVTNLSLSEAATLAGVIRSPHLYSPFNFPEQARARRNIVLDEMVEAGFISADASARAASDPLLVVARAIEAEAPYFVDFVTQSLAADYPDALASADAIEIHTTLDVHLQQLAQDAVSEGLTRIDRTLAARGGSARRAEAALIAVDARRGDILALVGGRSYSQSQFNRATGARRQPGSVFKPFVYLAAFEQAVATGSRNLTPASIVNDEPTAFGADHTVWRPANYGKEYDGPITLRRALAFSRNVATVKLAERVGYDRVAALWRRIGTGAAPRAYPSIALGVFEVTPLEMTAAYALFPNAGELRPLHAIRRIIRGGREMKRSPPAVRRVARRDTTFLVTHMMRGVMDEGTGAPARAAGFELDAAGKSGTTNDLRDAWFVGFTPDLLAVVWVGLDDNRPLGLSGTQAGLPIWTSFMMRALAGYPATSFDPPAGITFAEIDRDTGLLALPRCPTRVHEAFLAGTEPHQVCELHRY